jgi:hypothetical protein
MNKTAYISRNKPTEKSVKTTNNLTPEQVSTLNAYDYDGSDPFVSVYTSQSEKNPNRQYYGKPGEFWTWVDIPSPKRTFPTKQQESKQLDELRTRVHALETRVYNLEHYEEGKMNYG